MLKDEFEKCLKKRLKISAADDFSTQKSWDEEVALLSRNADETVTLINECSEEELYWMSEIFEEIFDIAEGTKIIAAIKERLKSFINQQYAASIQREIEYLDSVKYLV